MTLKEWALEYAKMGLAVFPLRARNKAPATKNGCKDATTDQKQIVSWWSKWPDSNIGIATGRASGGLVVIDLDRDEEKGCDGYEILREWQRQHGQLPDTCQSITGRGGYHLLYRDTVEHRNAQALYEGVDIRGEGGYIVAPPSVHPNGRAYEWEQGPDEFEIVQADVLVKEFLKGPKKEQQQYFHQSEVIPEGQRVSTLVQLIGSQRAKGLGEAAIRAAVQAENEEKCLPPLTDQELEKEVFPALKKGWTATHPYMATAGPDKKFHPVKSFNFNVEKAGDVIIKEPEWLIPGYIPKYGITTIAGEGGVGKTSIWCSLVASITTGKQSFLLGGQIPFENDPEDVLVLSAEDSWSYVLRRRLEACGADLDRIGFLSPEDERFVDLNFNGDLLKGIIETNRPSVIVFDPLQAFVPENLRMGDRNAMRKCFSPLIGYGEQYKLTPIIIAHANKQSGVWGRKRIADSSDIWDASRSVLMVGTTAEDGVRYISHEKSNWGRLESTVLFTLEDCVPTFKCYSVKKDKDFIQADARERNVRPVVEDAKDFIIDTLKERGQMEVSEMDELAKVTGISAHAMKEAKTALKKEHTTHTWSIGYGKDKKFYMSLKDPEKPAE